MSDFLDIKNIVERTVGFREDMSLVSNVEHMVTVFEDMLEDERMLRCYCDECEDYEI